MTDIFIPILGTLLLFLFASLPFVILFAISFIGLTFIRRLSGRGRLTALIAAAVSLAVNIIGIVIVSSSANLSGSSSSLVDDTITYSAVILAWLVSKLPFVIIVGLAAALFNLKKLIEGDDETSRKPRLIVYCAMLAALALGGIIDILSFSGIFDTTDLFKINIGDRTLTPGQLTAGILLGAVSYMPFVLGCAALAAVIYIILRLIRKKRDLIGAVIPIIFAIVAAVAIPVILTSNPIVVIPPEYEAFVDADELTELKSYLPGTPARFRYKIEITHADESSVSAWLCYFNRSYRTYCGLTRTADGFSPVFENEPCMNPFGW